MYIQDKFVYKLLTISLVLNFILLVLTMQVCRWYREYNLNCTNVATFKVDWFKPGALFSISNEK